MLDPVAGFLPGIQVGWRDIVDIAVVAFLIYQVLRLMRQTRAVQIALGGAILIAVYFGSQVATLRTANWIVGDMLGYVVFVAIVLFQSDIRRALSNLGRARFVRYLSRWPNGASGPSSSSSGTSASATTSRAASRSTRPSPTICSSACFSPMPRFMTAP